MKEISDKKLVKMAKELMEISINSKKFIGVELRDKSIIVQSYNKDELFRVTIHKTHPMKHNKMMFKKAIEYIKS